MIQSILVVCIGNICRSPAAEKLFQHALSDKFSISSAGLGAMVNYPIDANMRHCLTQSGLTNLDHQARQLTPTMVQQADLVLTMEKSQLDDITRMVPHAHGKTMLLGKWDHAAEVPDPYRKDSRFFQSVYNKITNHVDAWANKLA